MKWRVFKNICLFVLGPLLVVSCLFVLDRQGFFNIKEIRLEEPENFSSQAYYKNLLGDLQEQLDSFYGKSMWSVNLGKVKKVLHDQNWVKTFQITKSWPNKLEISITPQDIPFVLVQGEKFYPVNENAQMLKPVNSNLSPDGIVLVGSDFIKNEELRKKAIQVVNDIPGEGNFTRKNVAELGYREKDGFWLTLVESGLRVQLGVDDIEKKSNRIGQVVEYLQSNKFKARVIDANLSKKVLVKLRNDQ